MVLAAQFDGCGAMTSVRHNHGEIQGAAAASYADRLKAPVSERPVEHHDASAVGTDLAAHVLWQAGLAICGVVALACWANTYVLPLQTRTGLSAQSVYDDAAKDIVMQYRIGYNQGDKIKLCIYARMIASAYLHASNGAAHRAWRERERADCVEAGMQSR